MDVDQAQAWADRFFDERRERPSVATPEGLGLDGPGTGFSPFLVEDAARAREAARRLMVAADTAEGDPLDAVQREVGTLLGEQDRGVVRFALKVFLTHHPAGRGVRIPPLEQRSPGKVVPSAPEEPGVGAEALGAVEARLNWWREDPEANEHHDHWHVVYPTGGIPDPDDPSLTRLQDRQGELFFYMHQQMLARYDTERLAIGLPVVGPLTDHGAPIPEGYDPTSGLRGFPADWTDGQTPRARPDNARMPQSIQLPQVTVARSRLDDWFGRLHTAATSSTLLRDGGGLFGFTDTDPLGHATEPSGADLPAFPGQPHPDPRQYGNFHGLGHVFLASAAGSPLGVMADTDTAIRDPVFFRWHRHVDDLAFTWQETQQPHPLADTAAAVRLRRAATHAPGRPAESEDIVLLRNLPPGLDDAALAAHVTGLIGGDRFDDDVAATAPGTAELRTEMRTRLLDIVEVPTPPTVRIPYLDQDEFAYAVRLTNPGGTDRLVTVRLFIVADALFEQRRMWIELDKFAHTVSGPTSVAVRHARASAVIRKPGLKPPGPTRHSAPDDNPAAYCECGWPYNLLLPRGTGNGMTFWIAAVVTDGEQDRVAESTCGSMSFCGARDRYPDARPMGYPFDRPFAGGDIAAALDAQPSTAARSFTIRWVNPNFTV